MGGMAPLHADLHVRISSVMNGSLRWQITSLSLENSQRECHRDLNHSEKYGVMLKK